MYIRIPALVMSYVINISMIYYEFNNNKFNFRLRNYGRINGRNVTVFYRTLALYFFHELYIITNNNLDVIDYDRNISYSGGIIDLPIPEQITV